MTTRKKKPGVKRAVGRPPTARRRKAQSDRVKSERKTLEESLRIARQNLQMYTAHQVLVAQCLFCMLVPRQGVLGHAW